MAVRFNARDFKYQCSILALLNAVEEFDVEDADKLESFLREDKKVFDLVDGIKSLKEVLLQAYMCLKDSNFNVYRLSSCAPEEFAQLQSQSCKKGLLNDLLNEQKSKDPILFSIVDDQGSETHCVVRTYLMGQYHLKDIEENESFLFCQNGLDRSAGIERISVGIGEMFKLQCIELEEKISKSKRRRQQASAKAKK